MIVLYDENKLYSLAEEKQKELKPCPCCGAVALFEPCIARKGYECRVVCTRCLINLDSITYDEPEEAINKALHSWNLRKEML